MARFKNSVFSFLIAILVFSIIFTPYSSIAAHPNKKIVITDMLDDDIRALLHLLSDKETRGSVKALVITTGNVYLKAAIARKIVAGLGLKIPVYSGTSTNLANNNVTSFAANYEKEGAPLLSPEEIKSLRTMNGHSGNGASAISSILRETPNGEKIDILLLTAATDLNLAIGIDPEAAKKSLGDLFTMGLYKRNANNELVSPYNTMADTRAAKTFLEIVRPNGDLVTTSGLLEIANKGYFEHIYHVPSDVVQNNSGLPGGYIPNTGEGKKLRERLDAAMKQNPVLEKILTAAGEYALNWTTTANAEFGIGFSDSDRWVPGSFQNPHEAVGFYLADTVPTALLKMTAAQIKQLEFNATKVKTPDKIGNYSFKFEFDPEGREINDLKHFDGWSALKEHVVLLENAKQFKPLDEFYKKPQLPKVDPSEKVSKSSAAKNKNSLIIIFKNSPDDWFGLLEILATTKGKKALASGGIICEGFHTESMRDSVIGLLQNMGLTNIKVAAGTQYTRENIESIGNFKGEMIFNDLAQDDRAFLQLKYNIDLSQAASVDELLKKAQQSAQKNSAGIDAVILGEGIDLYRKISESPEFSKNLESIYVMGGGRIQNDKIVVSRNWIRDTKSTMSFIDYLGKIGKKVFVYSSNEFGGSMISTTEKNMGNGAVAFSALENAANTSVVMKAVFEHWKNWNRVFAWALGPNKDLPFDPEAKLTTLSTSPLGLRIANEYLGEHYSETTVQKTEVNFDVTPEGLVKTNKDGSGVFWASQFGGQTVVDLAEKFSKSVKKLTKTTQQKVKEPTILQEQSLSGQACEILFEK
ncbi:MAG: nucleoside hydrolase [Pseudobdellovibrionaceae bacterium]